MTTGRLGTADLATATLETVYTVPTDVFSVISVNICNRNNSSVGIRLAIADNDTPTSSEFIEHDVEIGGKGVLERTGIIIGAGQKVVMYSSSANVSVVVFGIETPTS